MFIFKHNEKVELHVITRDMMLSTFVSFVLLFSIAWFMKWKSFPLVFVVLLDDIQTKVKKSSW